jgi:hypothetical protein
VQGLSVALAIAIAVSAILAVRVKDESDQQNRARAEASALRDELDTIHRQQALEGKTILDKIASAIERIRALKFLKRVKPTLLSGEQLAEEVERSFREENPRSTYDQEDAILTALGLLGSRDDLYDITVAVVREQVGGFYDTKKKTLVVESSEKDHPSPLDQVLLSHEYVHAVTDQHYDLTRLDKLNASRKDDEANAYLSLIEGDATNMMYRYAAQYLTPSERSAVQTEAAAAPSQRLDAAPAALREALLFPYREGEQFVRSLLEAGGFEALDKAYEDPPTSTEQIIHVSKYLRTRDEPTAVKAPKLAATMGSGWKDLTGGEVGELDLRILIDQFLPRSDAERAAAGWDGGRYVAAKSDTGTVVAELTEWDSETQAREAADVLSRWLPRRYDNQGNNVQIDGATGRGWESPNGAGSITRVGTRVLLVVGPDRRSVDTARSAFRGF